jgi:hypothetical protein
VLLLTAALATLAVGSCGGDSESGGSGEAGFVVEASTTVLTGPLDKPQFVVRVNKICREGWAEILDNFTEYSSWKQEDGLNEDEAFKKSVRLSFLAGFDFHVFDPIYQLGGPPGEEKEIEDIIGALQLAVELGQRRINITSPEQLTNHFAEYNRLAQEYGLTDCLVDGERVKKSQTT